MRPTELFSWAALPIIDGEVLGVSVGSRGTYRWFTQTRRMKARRQLSERKCLWHGDDTLYIAVMAYDDNPEAILVTDIAEIHRWMIQTVFV